ncbi:hypothetical protein GTR02_19095 [Kineococcus sp. R8]|uniref:cell wall-binding repeat-containing protein n=1 Tax=Kineococcus siccus TaxID=2696567 RepID=UPI0014124A9C|nr:cell wall-binding repeat-containing protein [Kineococcus siccus]NAZ83922.1 hypothetical protein [Kineococcus siccus]
MRHRVTAALATTAVVSLIAATPAQAADSRVFGGDRYGTAAAVSQLLEDGSFNSVYLATGENFPDALAASAAAGGDQSRVLLTGRYVLPQATRDEMARLDASVVYLVGGTASVSTEVETELDRLGYTVLRLDGENRYDTSATVAQILFDDPDTVFLATGQNYPDALAGAAAAGSLGAPIVLVGQTTVPEAVREALTDDFLPLRPSRFFVLGGQGAIPDGVIDQIRGLGYQNATFERVGGDDRYATAVAVGQRFFASSPSVVLAVGDNFPDALAAGPFAAQTSAPLLLTQAATTPGATAAELARRNPQDRVYVGAARPS